MNTNSSTEIRITASATTAAGHGQKANEDSVALSDEIAEEDLSRKGHLYIVADGVGGHQKGDVASRIAVEVIRQAYYEDPDTDLSASLKRAIKAANAEIQRQAQNPTHAGMGTTVVAAIVHGAELIVAHVGDSRAYLLRESTLQQLTKDHSWVAEKVAAGVLTPQEAARHEMRHVITRSLGDQPSVEVTLNTYQLRPDDRVLLCSDGVWEPLSDETITYALKQKPKKAVHTMVEQASVNGHDDATALAISYGPVHTNLLEQARERLAIATASPQQRVLVIGASAILTLTLIVCGITRLAPGNATLTPTRTVTTSNPSSESTSEQYCIVKARDNPQPAIIYDNPSNCERINTSIPLNETIWIDTTSTYTNCDTTSLIKVTYNDRQVWINPWRIGQLSDEGECVLTTEWSSFFKETRDR